MSGEARGRRPRVVPALLAALAVALAACGAPEGGQTPTDWRPPPPTATLAFDDQRQSGGLGSFCWAFQCSLAIGIDLPDEPLVAPHGAALTLTISGTRAPTTLAASAFHIEDRGELRPIAGKYWLPPKGQQSAALPSNLDGLRAGVTVDLPPGEYVVAVWIDVRRPGEEGSALYGFYIVVK